MGARREKFLCPHCHLLSYDSSVSVCSNCVKDYAKVRQVEKLIREATSVKGLPEEVFLELWIWRCKKRKDVAALERAEGLKRFWKENP